MEIFVNTFEYLKASFENKFGALDVDYTVLALLLAVIALVGMPDAVVAQAVAEGAEGTIVSDAVCRVVNQLTGPIGRGVAAVAVIFVGFSLFLGKISWGLAIAIGMGIAAIFGANEIVSFFSGVDGGCDVVGA